MDKYIDKILEQIPNILITIVILFVVVYIGSCTYKIEQNSHELRMEAIKLCYENKDNSCDWSGRK